MTPLLAFLLVAALIPAVLWALKRSGVARVQTGGALRAIAHLNLGSAQRVSVVEVTIGAQSHWLVLGVTASQISSLAIYPAPDAAPTLPTASDAAQAPHTAAVNQLIARWRGNAGPAGSSGKKGAHDD